MGTKIIIYRLTPWDQHWNHIWKRPMHTQNKTLEDLLIKLQVEFLNGTYDSVTENAFRDLTLEQLAKLKTAFDKIK